MSGNTSRIVPPRHHRGAVGALDADRAGAGVHGPVPGAAAGRRVHRGAAQRLDAYWEALKEPDAWAAIRLTLITAAIAVPLNLVFGVAAAWAIAKFEFKGKAFLTTLIDLPFSVSPVVAGLIYVLVFGAQGWFGALAGGARHQDHLRRAGHRAGHRVRDLPVHRARTDPADAGAGQEEEQAAIVLGATGWQTFWHVTLPNIKWGLLYGVILCNARAMGEFGAVSVVSGHIRGQTNTMPLHVEILYNEYQSVAAFAVASLLALLALVTLVIKTEWRERDRGRRRTCRPNVRRCPIRSDRPPEDLSESMSIQVRNINKQFGSFHALRRRVARHPLRRTGGAARPLGLRQDHAAAHHRRAGTADAGQVLLQRRGHSPTCMCASARWASCSSTTRCSAT
jgi:sulfate transport system permease protein